MTADLLIADKAFDADERVITLLAAKDKAVVIPPKSNRKVARTFDRDLYKADRWSVGLKAARIAAEQETT